VTGRRRNPKERAFLAAYLRDPARNHIAAARVAGYANPTEQGSRVLRRLKDVIAAEEAKLSQHKSMSADEVLQGIEEVARDVEHRDRFSALLILAKIHHLIGNKDVKPGDRKKLLGDVAETLVAIKKVQKTPGIPAPNVTALLDS
jgi:hypothetical protein